MKCPRCESETVSLLKKAPLDHAWEIYICGTCTLSWRNTEPENITDPAKYDQRFKIDPANIEKLDQIPPIPELKK
ncbi:MULTISPECIES: non-oxidative hydroxyarylic acid decarboxylases subunit D [Paenibacillus]|uniref:non-oxidative hydroxyarylic acid decarboxylases subunit D n=1 Tax=Paenibacillus illinoisensis TaxID=59845 RepID=UPI001C8D22D3|nr:MULTISPECIES: non-oxidative hydroxyarylic acid decarboxylases subunit D [Paenibacillus]MBY0215341.1 vanillic acid non-oxidative decarboxylation protein [Paenibacillus illinoisensis]WJH29336.1 vanillic acid non-oxidative decarboxylation protein [Paenibacillus sp. CC-CFT742]